MQAARGSEEQGIDSAQGVGGAGRAVERERPVFVVHHDHAGVAWAERRIQAHDRRVRGQRAAFERSLVHEVRKFEALLHVFARAQAPVQILHTQLHGRRLVRAGGEDGLRRVLHAPARGETEREVEVAVIKLGPAADALAGAVAERELVEVTQVVGARRADGGRGFELVRLGHHLLQPPVVARVGGEDTVVDARLAPFFLGALFLELLLVFEHADDADHSVRIEARARQILGPQPVGLKLVVAPVTREQRVADHVHELLPGLATEFRHHGRQDIGADAGGGRRGILAHRMARGHVADLVAQHRGELSLGVQVGENPAGDVDVAAGERKGVDLR